VRPESIAACLDDVLPGTGPAAVEVVAYRPAERAVVRVSRGGRVLFVKAVPPSRLVGIVARHEALARAGLPVPAVVAAAVDGWFAMEALPGPTLRDRIKAWPCSIGDAAMALPDADAFEHIFAGLAAVQLDDLPAEREIARHEEGDREEGHAAVTSARPTRTCDAAHHAALLARILPEHAGRLGELAEQMRKCAVAAQERVGPVVHGDLHEAQVVLDGRRITGLLDIDDVGAGDPFDDRATLLAHLTFRAIADPATTSRLWPYIAGLRSAMTSRRRTASGTGRTGLDAPWAAARAAVCARTLDEVTAAVLLGLAGGPFRVQHPNWKATALAVIGTAEVLLDSRHAAVRARVAS
jgi:aminoglycoside phosphotransferase (APT) family kinase protein